MKVCMEKLGFELEKDIKFEFHEDPDISEEQIYAYKDILNKLKELLDDEGMKEKAEDYKKKLNVA